MRTSTATTAIGLLCLAATAFAPIAVTSHDSASELPPDQLVTDDDPTTTQAVVLLVGTGQDAQAAYDAQPVPDEFAYASVDLGCGDAGGPEARARLEAVARHLGGSAPGTAGPVAAVAEGGLPGLTTLGLARRPQGTAVLDAVIVDGAIHDLYELFFSENGVPRSIQLHHRAVPCLKGGDPLGARDSYYAQRSTSPFSGQVVPELVGHALDAVIPVEQAFHMIERRGWDLQQGQHGLHVRRSIGTGMDHETVFRFLQKHLLDIGDGLEPDGGLVRESAAAVDCAAGPCLHSTPDLVRGIDQIEFHAYQLRWRDDGDGPVGSLEEVPTDDGAPTASWEDAPSTGTGTSTDPGGATSAPGGTTHRLTFFAAPVQRTTLVLGRPHLDAPIRRSGESGTITPDLVIHRSGTTVPEVVSRGADTQHRGGAWDRMFMRLDPVVAVLRPGDRIGLVLRSNDVGHFVPGRPMGTVDVALSRVSYLDDLGRPETANPARLEVVTAEPLG